MAKLLIVLLACASCLRAQSSDLTQALLSIQEAIQAGDLATASRLIEISLQQHSGDGGLLNLRGVVHARRNELDQARADFAEAVRRAPDLAPGWQNLARACQLEAEHDASSVSCAIDSWQHVLRLRPLDAEAHSSLALLYAKLGKFAESLREIERLPAKEAAGSGIEALRCLDLSALGRVPEAKTVASRLAKRADFSESDLDGLQEILDLPKSASAVVMLVEALDARNAASLRSLRRLAVAYEQLQHPSDARKTLERVAVLDPNNTAHLFELARLADAAKDYKGALGYLAHARDLAPDNARIHFLFAMIAMKLDLPIEARRSLERALALDPENPAYNYAMGSAILTTRDAATASSYFQKFVKAKPSDVRGHYALGIAYFASGDYQKAKQEMQRAESNPATAAGAEYFLGRMARLDDELDDAARRLQESIRLMPSFSESHTELARVLMRQGKLKEAQQELDQAVKLAPDSFQANEQLLVLYRRTHDSRAEKQAELLKKLDQARSERAGLMLRTLEVKPEIISPEDSESQSAEAARAERLSVRGGVEFLNGKMREAAAAFGEAAALASLKDSDSFTFAMALVSLGDDAHARALLTGLADKHPDRAIYLYWLGRLDYDQRRYQEAVKKLAKSAELDPGSARIWDSLGLAQDMQGQLEEALHAFEKAASLNRDQARPSPWPPHDLGYLLLRMERLKDAEAALRESLRYDPKLAQAHYHLGRTLEKERQETGAIQEYESAISGDTASPDACYSLAMLYRKLHRDSEASAMFAEYKKRQQAAPK